MTETRGFLIGNIFPAKAVAATASCKKSATLYGVLYLTSLVFLPIHESNTLTLCSEVYYVQKTKLFFFKAPYLHVLRDVVYIFSKSAVLLYI